MCCKDAIEKQHGEARLTVTVRGTGQRFFNLLCQTVLSFCDLRSSCDNQSVPLHCRAKIVGLCNHSSQGMFICTRCNELYIFPSLFLLQNELSF